MIFGYENGAAMSGLTAPGRRVGFFLENTAASALTTAGGSLFDAAVRWAPVAGPGARPRAARRLPQHRPVPGVGVPIGLHQLVDAGGRGARRGVAKGRSSMRPTTAAEDSAMASKS